jgi:pimeloyl-ACP methyl ester carboxylesterase
MKVFYLHGMGGSPSDWEAVTALVPGTCLPLPSTAGFSAATQALAGQLEKVAEPFVLCGYSMGGRLALAASGLLQTQNLRGLALLAAGLGFSDEKDRTDRRQKDREWSSLARQDPGAFWKKWYAQELFSTFHALPSDRREPWMRKRLCLDIEGLCAQLEFLSPAQHGSLRPLLEKAQEAGIKLLYMAGERDKKYAELAQQLGKEGVPVSILPGGHILPLEAPEAVARGLEFFLRTV